MTGDLLARLIAGARTGSLVLTVSELVTIDRELRPNAAIAVDGRVVALATLPRYVLPDTPGELLELDPWRTQLHASLTEGLITRDDHARIWNRLDDIDPGHA